MEKNPFRLIMKVDRTLNRLYRVELKTAEPACFLTSVSEEAWLWHGRLGHANFQSIKFLVDKEMALGAPVIKHPDQLCQACLAPKQTHTPFPQAAN